jgi:hypothetical protein
MRPLNDPFLRPTDLPPAEHVQSDDDRSVYAIGLSIAAIGGAVVGSALTVGVLLVSGMIAL